AYKQVHDRPAPPSSREADVAPPLEAIILKLLAKNPANRYATADDLRADLRRYRDGRAVTAEPLLAPPVAPTGVAAAAPADATVAVPRTRAPAAYQDITTMQPGVAPTAHGHPPGPGGYGQDLAPMEPEPPRRVGVYVGAVLGALLIIGAIVFGALQLAGGG